MSSDAFSKDKIDHMKSLGAEVTIVPSKGRGITKELIDEMIETASKFNEEPDTYWTDQLNNEDHVSGYFSLGEEIWEQTNGQIDALVHVVGSAASLKGTSKVLKRYKPDLRIIAVEPAESPVLSGGKSEAHGIGGIGIGFEPGKHILIYLHRYTKVVFEFSVWRTPGYLASPVAFAIIGK